MAKSSKRKAKRRRWRAAGETPRRRAGAPGRLRKSSGVMVRRLDVAGQHHAGGGIGEEHLGRYSGGGGGAGVHRLDLAVDIGLGALAGDAQHQGLATGADAVDGGAGDRAQDHLRGRARLGAARAGRVRRQLYDALMAAGAGHGLRDAGYRAIESLRLEKGYRAWGAEIGPDHSPLMAGLGFAVKLRGDTPFLGRDALEAERQRPLPRLLAGFAVADPAVVLLGRETIYRDGRRAGWLASGGWGYTVGRGLGYGYVRDPEHGVTAAEVRGGSYELEVGTERVPAEVFLRPLYDPDASRIR